MTRGITHTDFIHVGDIVELMPTNNRNRQLRAQDKKLIWEVIKVDRPQCLNKRLGYFIEHKDGHTRWVEPNEVLLLQPETMRNRK